MHNSNQPGIDGQELSQQVRAAELQRLRAIEARRPLSSTALLTAGMMGLQLDANGRIYDPQVGETKAPAAQPLTALIEAPTAKATADSPSRAKRGPTAHELMVAGMSGKRFDVHGNLIQVAGAPLGAVR